MREIASRRPAVTKPLPTAVPVPHKHLAPTPSLGRQLSRSKIAAALRRGGRQRRIEERAAEIHAALRTDQLAAPEVVSEAMGSTDTFEAWDV